MKGLRFVAAVFAVSVFALGIGTACGGDSGGSGGGTTQDATNNNEPDATHQNNKDKPDTQDAEETTETSTNNNSGGSGEIKTPCEKSNPPERCNADPSSYEWAPTSVVSSLEISPSSISINGNDFDSQIGTTISDFGQLQTANDSIDSNIQDGTLILLLEHDRIKDLTNTGQNFDLHVWLGAFAGETSSVPQNPGEPNTFNVREQSIDRGTQSGAYWAGAKYTSANKVTGEAGGIPIKFKIQGAQISARIENAAIEATVDTNQSKLDGTGIFHTDGKLGGVIPLADIHDSINNFVDSCSCIEGLENRQLVDYQDGNPKEFTCAERGKDFNSDSCGSEGKENICATVASTCTAVSGILTPDKDLNGDGVNDALSVAIKYSAVGADIVGVTDAELGGGSGQ